MKKIFNTLSAFGLSCLLYVSVYAQNCTTITKINPNEISNPVLIIGESRNISFSFEDSGHQYISDATLQITSGTLPPGIVLYSDSERISGTPTTVGTYTFTLGASTGPGCPVFEEEYTLEVRWNRPCEQFAIDFGGELGFGFVGEEGTAQACPYPHPWDSIQYSVISLPKGYHVYDYEAGDECMKVKGAAQQDGPLHFIIAAQTADGCTDTVDYVQSFRCLAPDSIYPSNTMLRYAIKGQPYSETFSISLLYTVASVRYEIDNSIPGLSLERRADSITAVLSGTPTTPGTYKFRMRAIIGDSCIAGDQVYTLMVTNDEPVKSLTIFPLCNESYEVRNWRIHNPNNFPVAVKWNMVYYFSHFIKTIDAITAAPGNTYFETPNIENPNTINISWYDGVSSFKNIVRSASTELCDPPACVYASNVIKYTVGLQKDGRSAYFFENDPKATRGEPDANDSPDALGKYFTLGYNGFIVLQLSSIVSDQPGNDLTVYEYSEGNPTFGQYPERAEVFVSKDGSNWISLGLTSPPNCQGTLDHSFDLAGKTDWCRYVKVVDKTDRHARVLNPVTCAPTSALAFDGGSNGFDLDAITCGQAATFARLSSDEENAISDNGIYILSPNPAEHHVTLDLSLDQSIPLPPDGEVEINVRDARGAKVYNRIHALEGNSTITLEVADFQSGMYILNVRSGVHTSRFYKFIRR